MLNVHSLGRAARRYVIAALLLGSMTAPAYAGPPFQVDDPEPTPYRHYEIYVISQYQHDLGSTSGSAPALEINYGLMRGVQFSVTTQMAAARESGAFWHTGFGDTEVALKMRFMTESSSRPQIAFYPAVVLPTGNAAAGLGDGNTKIFLPVWAQKSVGKWTVFGGGGLWHTPGAADRDYTFAGIAAQREVTERFSYGAELFHQTAVGPGGHGSTGFNLGMTRGLDEQHKVLFSAGRSMRGSNAFTAYAAYQLNLGPKASEASLLDSGLPTPQR